MRGVPGTAFHGHCVTCGKELVGIRPWRFRKNPNRRCRECCDRSKKGFYIHAKGYVVLTDGNKEVFEHRAVMEKILGRKLRRGEIVHHRNENRVDNRPENLELCKNTGTHIQQHHAEQQRRGRWGK